MSTRKTRIFAQVKEVDVSDEGIVITFHNRQKAFFDAQYLFDHQDVSGNFPLVKDDFDAP